MPPRTFYQASPLRECFGHHRHNPHTAHASKDEWDELMAIYAARTNPAWYIFTVGVESITTTTGAVPAEDQLLAPTAFVAAQIFSGPWKSGVQPNTRIISRLTNRRLLRRAAPGDQASMPSRRLIRQNCSRRGGTSFHTRHARTRRWLFRGTLGKRSAYSYEPFVEALHGCFQPGRWCCGRYQELIRPTIVDEQGDESPAGPATKPDDHPILLHVTHQLCTH